MTWHRSHTSPNEFTRNALLIYITHSNIYTLQQLFVHSHTLPSLTLLYQTVASRFIITSHTPHFPLYLTPSTNYIPKFNTFEQGSPHTLQHSTPNTSHTPNRSRTHTLPQNTPQNLTFHTLPLPLTTPSSWLPAGRGRARGGTRTRGR